MREETLTAIRREALRHVQAILVAGETPDEVRQTIVDRMCSVCDDLLVKLARHTEHMNSHDATVATRALFVLGWPVLCSEAIPGMLLRHGLDRLQVDFGKDAT